MAEDDRAVPSIEPVDTLLDERRAFVPVHLRQRGRVRRCGSAPRPHGSSTPIGDAFNNGDQKAMAAARADPMQILDRMSPHVWQGPTANDDETTRYEGEHLGASATTSSSTSRDTSMPVPTNTWCYLVVPATMAFAPQRQQRDAKRALIYGGASQGRRRLATFRLGLGERQVSPTHTTTGVASFGRRRSRKYRCMSDEAEDQRHDSLHRLAPKPQMRQRCSQPARTGRLRVATSDLPFILS